MWRPWISYFTRGHGMPLVIISKLTVSVYCGFRDAISQQQGVPRSLWRNPVLYSTTFLSDGANHYSSTRTVKGNSMDVSTSKAVVGGVRVHDIFKSCSINVLDSIKPTCVYIKGLQASVNPGRPKPLSGLLSFGYSSFDATRGNQYSSTASYSAGAAHDVSLDGSTPEEELANSSISIDQSCIGGPTIKLFSGSCSLPHPDKEEIGGEDAHFICTERHAIGVADGVSAWAAVGVNSGIFARELMSNSLNAIQEEPEGSINLMRVLEKAHSNTKARGSSTACIIALTDEGLHAINLGDSGFIVIGRNGRTIFRSPVQLHGFGTTYQMESGNGADLPSSAEVFTMSVAPGDVVVAGTDGLFDNLYPYEVVAIVVSAIRTRLEPEVTAQKIAALASKRAMDKNRKTPFSTAAEQAGRLHSGGKLDDITVIVSYITNSSVHEFFSRLR